MTPDDNDEKSPDGVIRAHYEWNSVRPAIAVVESVATASDREPTALEPLFGAIDPDALNAVVRSTDSFGPTTVRFDFAGYNVTVQSDGTLVVRPSVKPE